MTRKDYELIAKAFADSRPACECHSDKYLAWLNAAVQVTSALSATNARFDSARFIAACKAN